MVLVNIVFIDRTIDSAVILVNIDYIHKTVYRGLVILLTYITKMKAVLSKHSLHR